MVEGRGYKVSKVSLLRTERVASPAFCEHLRLLSPIPFLGSEAHYFAGIIPAAIAV